MTPHTKFKLLFYLARMHKYRKLSEAMLGMSPSKIQRLFAGEGHFNEVQISTVKRVCGGNMHDFYDWFLDDKPIDEAFLLIKGRWGKHVAQALRQEELQALYDHWGGLGWC